MTDTPLKTDPRRRRLLVLGGIAATALLLAALAVWHQSSTERGQTQIEFFPGFASRVAHHEATRIHVVSKANGAFDVVFNPVTGWVMASRNNFPASFEQVNGTLVNLAAMQTIEPKTSRPEWLHYVGLDAPPAGDGVLIVVSNEKGETLASLIAGKTADIGDETGATGLFARKPDSKQSWLVRAVSEIRSAPTDWMEKSVMDVDRARIQSVDVIPAQGTGYSVHRIKPSDPDFTLSPIPAGREVSDPSAPDGVAAAAAGFSFDDVRRASELDFAAGASRLITKTFDGLIVTATTIKSGNDVWATLLAEAAPGHLNASKEARDINTRANGWAYKLASFKAALFTTPLENLLKPKGVPVKTGP